MHTYLRKVRKVMSYINKYVCTCEASCMIVHVMYDCTCHEYIYYINMYYNIICM
jgi:hypothetical protein